MTREIILVEVVNGNDLSTDDCRAFTDDEKAKEYFIGLIWEYKITDDIEEAECFYEDGFCDFENMSIITKCIILEED